MGKAVPVVGGIVMYQPVTPYQLCIQIVKYNYGAENQAFTNTISAYACAKTSIYLQVVYTS